MGSSLLQKLLAPWNGTFQRVRPHLRGDTVIAIGIPIACIGVLIEAYHRTDYDDADTSSDAQFTPSNECINSCACSATATASPSTVSTTAGITSLSNWNENVTKNSIVETLERDGIVIIPNAISPTVLSAVRENIQSLQQHQHQRQGETSIPPHIFAKSGNDTDVRQDKIVWIRHHSMNESDRNCTSTLSTDSDLDLGEEISISTKNGIGCELEYCIDFIRGIPYALEKNGYTISRHHRIPKQCQLAMYSGDNISSYRRHLDTCTSTIYELGLLEFLRLSDYRQRRITIILYLNESHRPIHHGGTLRCWVSKELSDSRLCQSPSLPTLTQDDPNSITAIERTNFYPSFDIQPKGGTLVIFQSHRYVEK